VALLRWIEVHKDFWLVIAALVAPFAAVFVALVSSKRQAQALLEATQMQIRSAAFREYRQRNIEKLREELAAQIFYLSELRFGQQELGLRHAAVQEMLRAGSARRTRIGLLVTSPTDVWSHFINLHDQLIDRIQGGRPLTVWSLEENQEFTKQIRSLELLGVRVVESQVEAALER